MTRAAAAEARLNPPPGLILPSGASIRGVLPDAARSLGLELPELPSAALDLPSTERVVVVLVDGLGARQLAARAGHAPTLRALLAGSSGGGTGAAGYPTTTASSLASLGTGRSPGETGMLGYTVRDSGGRLLNLVQWADPAGSPAPAPRLWQPHPTVFEELAGVGVAATNVALARFAGSGLTNAALRGARHAPADTLAAAVSATVSALREPGLAYLYWGGLDHAGHARGWGSVEWGEELAQFDAALAALLRRLPSGTPVVITADHGMVDVTEKIDVADEPALREGVDVVAGEPRAMHVHLAKPGQAVDTGAVDAAAARWRDRLGDRAWVVPGSEAIAGGLFGEVDPRNAPLIGDLVVAMRGTSAVVDSRTQTPGSLRLVGMHGSLTPDEVEIPLLVATA